MMGCEPDVTTVTNDFSYWGQTITVHPDGETPTLSAWINTDSIAGKGVYIAIRCDDTTTPATWSNLEGSSDATCEWSADPVHGGLRSLKITR